MYPWLYRTLPGPPWVRWLLLLAFALAVVVILFEWVFPAVAPLVPNSQNTVT